MRIDELNMFQNFLKSVTGTAQNAAKPTNTKGVGSAWLRGRKSGLSTEDQLAQDIFVQKFVSRGANALNTAIQQGLVDVDSADLNQTASAPSQATAQAQATGQAQPGSQPAAGKQNTGIDANVKKISRSLSQLQPTGTKPIPKKAAQEIATDLPKVSLNKDYLVRVGEKILKLNSVGYDVKDFHKQFIDQYNKGTRAKSIQESIGHERLTEIYRKLSTQEKFRRSLKRAGYDPDEAAKRIRDLLTKQQQEREQYRDVYKDLGVDIDKHRVDLDERGPLPGAVPKVAAPASAPAPKPQAKVNPQQQKPKAQAKPQPQVQPKAQPKAQASTQQQAQPAQQQVAAKPSIGAWLRDNFMKGFLRGIDLGTAQQQVDDILKRMPQSYKAGTLNKDLTDIANIAYAVSDQGRKQDR